MNDAQLLRARMPLANMKYTREVDELYRAMLDKCKDLASQQYSWNKFNEWPIQCSPETCKTVLERFQAEGFNVHDYRGTVYNTTQKDNDTLGEKPPKPYVYVIDWVEPCTFKCDAQAVQMLHPGMIQEAINTKALYLYSKALPPCNSVAVDGDYSYRFNLPYFMAMEIDSGMPPNLRVPVVQRLLALLKEQGFYAQELNRGNSDFIDISWLVDGA